MAADGNYTLFDESEFQPRKRSGADVLVIQKRKGKVLSKEQRTFNRLTRRIAELEHRMMSDRDKLDVLAGYYSEQVAPAEKERAQRQTELVRALTAAGARLALQKRHKADLREMLLDLFDEIFAVTKPDAQMEALYDEWADTSYQEEVRQEAALLKRSVVDSLRDDYDIKVDASEYDESPEAMARFMHKAREKVREAEVVQSRGRSRRRRGSKQEDREAQLREREVLTRKSVREIYLSLAKVLHPDAVADAAERSLREDFMKQATLAYRHGDIAALLRLELRWVTRDDAGTSALSDEVLRAYIPALHEQLARLERALSEQIFDPRYAPVSPLAAMPQCTALARLRDQADALRAHAEEIDRQADFVKNCASKRDFTAFVRDYHKAKAAEWDFEDMAATILTEDGWD